ncbi:MAG: hypothetical protein PHY16_07885 [Methylobacter sp.]|nr:hypothetical protein [Methylobacter sp.]
MQTLMIAITSIVFSVAAQFALKAGMSSMAVKEALSHSFALRTILVILTNKFVILGFTLYGLGAMVWLGVLSRWDVSKAYPLVGLGFGLTALIGLLLGEQVTVSRAIGVALICSGVFLVGRS